jgi:metal-dependent hydrolase (beta-lactamase superfamily II)
MDFHSMKKKLYTPPILKELTEEQTKKLVADRKHCTEEEAAEFLKSLRKRQQNDATDQQRKRSA